MFFSGGMRAAAMALCIQNYVLPPTLGLSQPIAPLNFTLNAATKVRLRYGLINGVASGGTFAALIMKEIA